MEICDNLLRRMCASKRTLKLRPSPVELALELWPPSWTERAESSRYLSIYLLARRSITAERLSHTARRELSGAR